MPYSFSRIALARGRWVAWFANNRENVVDIKNSQVHELESDAMLGLHLTPCCRFDDNLALLPLGNSPYECIFTGLSASASGIP